MKRYSPHGDDADLALRIAGLLASMRERRGISQEALAVELGHVQSFVSRLETGQRRVTVAEMLQFASALDIPFSEVAQELEHIWSEHVRTESIWRREQP